MTEHDSILEHLIEEMNKATARAEKAIADTLEFVEASNKRIALMELHAKSTATN